MTDRTPPKILAACCWHHASQWWRAQHPDAPRSEAERRTVTPGTERKIHGLIFDTPDDYRVIFVDTAHSPSARTLMAGLLAEIDLRTRRPEGVPLDD